MLAGLRAALCGLDGATEALSSLAVGADHLFAGLALDCGAELTARSSPAATTRPASSPQMLGDRDLLDHVSLRSIARNLCRLFWRDLEIHHPGIDSLRLAPEVAQAWKERLAYIRAVDQQRKDAENRITAARATPAGERFLVAGQEFERCRSGQANRVYATELTTGRRRNLTHEEEAGFWSWATVEVLRHTVIRIEEMLELTHHSFIAYTLPTTGEVVPMLQVAPRPMPSACCWSRRSWRRF
ncbi:hypothetical protein HFP43_28630 [Streptomyces sp. SJ1-7]|nr:hypothetical protein [Streptomyces sp. SJ1-7]